MANFIKGITDKENEDTQEKTLSEETTLDTDLEVDALSQIPDAIEELEETYNRKDLLFVPEKAKKFYKEKGYELHWVRIIEPGSKDYDQSNIQRRTQQGYVFVKRNEVPGLDDEVLNIFGDVMTDSRGLYVVKDSALARIPTALVEKRRKDKEKRIRQRSESVIADLRKNALAPQKEFGEEYEVTRTQPNKREVDFGE